MKNSLHVAIVIASMRTGGAERALHNLANAFCEKDIRTDLVLVENRGEFISLINSKVNIHDLKKKRARHSIIPFKKYLKSFSPDVLIVAQNHIQLMVMIAMLITKWNGMLILNEQSTYSSNNKNIFYNFLFKKLFKRANAITVVSEGSAIDLSKIFPSMRDKIVVIPNAIFSNNIISDASKTVAHPFLDPKMWPVILSAGRLTKSKNFSFLLDAFSLLSKKIKVHLIILGDGEEIKNLMAHSKKLKIDDLVSFPGNVSNPYAFMKRCDVFALSSTYEGLPSVLVEALACGCNIVSTDCPNGPSEILDKGKYGKLIKLNDVNGFAEALLTSLDENKNENIKLNRAKDFSADVVVEKYLQLIKRITVSE